MDAYELQRSEDDVVPEKKSDAYDEWRMEREYQVLEEIIKRIGFRELKLERYSESHPGKDEYLLSHYYIATK